MNAAGSINGDSSAPQMEVPEWRVWKFIIQMSLALEHIHGKGIIHADLKPQNILLTGKDYDIRLADFGVIYF